MMEGVNSAMIFCKNFCKFHKTVTTITKIKFKKKNFSNLWKNVCRIYPHMILSCHGLNFPIVPPLIEVLLYCLQLDFLIPDFFSFSL
jgi:hypothetical protein